METINHQSVQQFTHLELIAKQVVEVFRFYYAHNGGMQQWDISQILIRQKQYKEIQLVIVNIHIMELIEVLYA